MKIPWYLMAKGKGGGTKTASGPIAHWTDGVAAPLRSIVANIEPVQSGSGDPSPDNVRPISGWSAVNVWRTGKNLADPADRTDTTYNVKFGLSDGILLKAGVSYTFSVSEQALGLYFRLYTDSLTALASAYNATKVVYTPTADTLVTLDAYYVPAPTGGTSVVICQLEVGSTATAYEPYSGNQYTLQLGQTIYGGTLDVTNGVLTVDRAMVTFDGSNDEAWNDYSNYNGYYIQLNAMKSGNRQDGWSNMLKDSKTSAQGQIGAMWLGVNNSKNFFVIGVHDTMGATLSVFRSYLSEHPLELVYPLATPITIPLTPTQISTLQGQNNVWADSGDVTVEYLSSGGANPDLMKLAVAFMGRK